MIHFRLDEKVSLSAIEEIAALLLRWQPHTRTSPKKALHRLQDSPGKPITGCRIDNSV